MRLCLASASIGGYDRGWWVEEWPVGRWGTGEDTGSHRGWATCSVDNVYIEYNMMHWRKLDVWLFGEENIMQSRHADKVAVSACLAEWYDKDFCPRKHMSDDIHFVSQHAAMAFIP